MSSGDEPSFLTLNEPEGTSISVESFSSGNLYDAEVDGDGHIRYEENGAVFNKQEYFVKSIHG